MSTIRENRGNTRLPDPDFVHPELVAPESTSGKVARYAASAVRLAKAGLCPA